MLVVKMVVCGAAGNFSVVPGGAGGQGVVREHLVCG